jgi:hypothetical protein
MTEISQKLLPLLIGSWWLWLRESEVVGARPGAFRVSTPKIIQIKRCKIFF